MTDLARLVLTADTTGLRRGSDALRDLERQAGRTESAARRTNEGMAGLTSRLLALGGAYLSLRGAMGLADEFTSLSNSLRIVADDGTMVADTLAEIAGIANRTRTPISGVAMVYQRASMAAQELGASQDDLARFTENVGLALGQTGQSGAAASGALLQLSQALGAGTVRAEEFNSILEGAYPIAQAAARGIDEAGGSVARLRQLVIAGEISSQEFFEAILSQTDALKAAFASTTPTIGQAFTVLRNGLVMAVGQFDQTLGISKALASALIAVAGELDRVVSYVAAGVLVLAGYQAALIAATVATGGLAGATLALRTALMRTGFGLVIVALGEIIYQVTQAAEKVGGFGRLFDLVKAVAVEALGRIGMGLDYVKATAAAAAAGLSAAFMGAIGRIGAAFANLTWTIADGMNGLFGMNLRGMAFNPDTNPEFFGAWNDAVAAAEDAKRRVSGIAEDMTAPLKSLGLLNLALGLSGSTAGALQGELASAGQTAEDTATTLDDLGAAAGGAAGGMERALTETEAFDKAMQDAAMTAEELGTAKADALVGGIDGVSQAFGDFIATGLTDFKGFAESVLASFQRLIAEMIVTAARNKILLALGFAAPTGAAAATGAAGMGGGGFMSMLSGMGSAMFSGATSWLGGIGAGMQALSGATAGLTGFATAVGAAIAPLAALGLLFTAFRGKTKLLDAGFRLTADGADLLVTTFKKTEKSRFFGLVKSQNSSEGAAPDAVADPLQAAYADIQGSVLDMGAALGKGSNALRDFSYEIKLSTKGMSDEEAAQALSAELAKMSDAMAKAVLGGTKFVREGETTTEALARLSSSLVTANAAMTALSLPLFKVSVAGAAAASAMVDVLGGLEGFNQAVSFYMQNFYSLPEQLAAASKEFRAAVKEMGLSVPKTAEQFRALVDSLMAAGKVEEAATLIGLAPLFVDIQRLKDEIASLGDNAGKASEELARLNKAQSEQESLQRQVYELTGNTAALRAMELAALEPENHALQQHVWALEDAKKALDDLTTDGFATLFDYERALGRAAAPFNVGPTSEAGLPPPPPPPAGSAANDNRDPVVLELKSLRADVERLRREQAAQATTAAGYAKDTRDTLIKFDRTGMPAVRS